MEFYRCLARLQTRRDQQLTYLPSRIDDSIESVVCLDPGIYTTQAEGFLRG